MECHPDQHDFYWKIIGSRWFQRAWCAHEMRMGKNHIFFVPCEDQNTVLRMSARFLKYLVILATEVAISRQCPHSVTVQQNISASRNLLYDNLKDSRNTAILDAFNDIDQLSCGGDPDSRLSPEQRAQTAIRDKLVITLNNYVGSNSHKSCL